MHRAWDLVELLVRVGCKYDTILDWLDREKSTIPVEKREKAPYGLSRCHTKRRTGARGRARPSFGMTPTF